MKPASLTRGLPLLAKELLELSARPRTYLIRVVYASALLFFCWLDLSNHISNNWSSPLRVIGVGARLLIALGTIQTLALFLVVPITACGTLTVEKERKTLDLLLITRLGPGTIILEKFFSRLVPAMNFVLVSAPVVAFCYSLGGIELENLILLLLYLILCAIQLTAIGVMCSAFYQTTVRALVAAYICSPLAYLLTLAWLMFEVYAAGLRSIGVFNRPVYQPVYASGLEFLVSVSGRTILSSIPSLLVSALCLISARHFLMSMHHHVPPKVLSRRRLNHDSELRFNWGYVDTPLNDPISWREGPRIEGLPDWRKTGTYATGFLVVILLAICSQGLPRDAVDCINRVSYLAWFLLTLWICVAGSGSIVRERTQQTLDVLLMTPMTGPEIVHQKMASIQRVVWLGRMGLSGCVLCHMIFSFDISYLVNSALMIWLIPELIAWQAMVCGLSSKNSTTAILKSLLLTIARGFVPYLLVSMLAPFFNSPPLSNSDFLFILAFVSPLTLIAIADQFLEHQEIYRFVLIGPITTSVVCLISVAYLRNKATRHSDRLLGRIPALLRSHEQPPNEIEVSPN